jgi:hypothetical protein
MNQNINDRVRSTMHAAAASVQLAESDPNRARRRAHERSTRRRRAVALGAVAASSVGMVVGVQAFSRPQPDTVRTVDQGSASSVDPIDDTMVEPTLVAPAVVTEYSGQAALEAPAFVWKVVEPGQNEALSGVFLSHPASTFPTLAVSTAPGRSNDYDNPEMRIWRTDDGVNWNMTDLVSPFGKSLWNTTSIGSHVFTVGTASGVAVDQPNPLQVAFSDGTTRDWTTVDLPIDDNLYRQIPELVATTDATAVPITNGVLVAVTPNGYIDPSKVAGLDESRVYDASDDGFVLLDDGCDIDGAMPAVSYVPSEPDGADGTAVPVTELAGADTVSSPTATVASVGVAAPTTPSEDFASEGTVPAGTEVAADLSQCDRVTKTWAELGVSLEAQAAMGTQPTQFFEVRTDGTVVAIESPLPGRSMNLDFATPGAFVDSANENALWSDDGAQPVEHTVYSYATGEWTSSTQPVVNWNSSPTMLGDAVFGFAYQARSFGLTTVSPDGSVGTIDMAGLFEDNTTLEAGASAATDDRFVSVARSWSDPIAEQGGVELTKDGVTVRRETMNSEHVYLDASTGEPIPAELIAYTENGGVEIDDGDGIIRASFSDQELSDAIYDFESQQQSSGPWNIVTTADGTNFSVESIAELTGLDDADISSVPRISTDGTQVVIAVSLNDRYPDETRKQIVLVGTPIR